MAKPKKITKVRPEELEVYDEQRGGWRTISSSEFPPVWLPKRDGDVLRGRITRISQGRFGAIWRVRRDDGAIMVLPNHVALLSRLEDAGVGPGWDVRITCTSMGSRQKGDYYDYDIAVREPRAATAGRE